jgi:hypothetical protein
MQTTIKSVDVEWVGSGAKKYGKAKVTHVGDKGEKTQYLVSFKNPEVFKKVQELVGQTVEVDLKKDGDFWQWVSIQGTTANSSGPTANATAPVSRVSGSNYETKEERAARQVLIVKQSSLSAAVATLTPGAKAALDPTAVKDLAQTYTDWVFEKAEDKSGFDSMDDDIPF